jgi:hypothetical protein
MRKCCIITPHPFWRERMGCGTLMRSRYKLLRELFDEVLVLFITKSDETCPLPGATLRLRQPFHAQHRTTIQSYVKNKNISLCYFSYDYWPGIAETVDCQTALELHDVMHLRSESFNKFGVSCPISKTKGQEIEELKKFDVVFCLNLEEVNYLQTNAVPCIYLPPTFSFQMITQPEHEPMAGMIGSAAKPNIDGLTQLMKSCDGCGDLVIAGALSKLDLPVDARRHRLTKLGYVATPQEFYSKINVALSPIRFGAGLKIKVLEALANGCGVLATKHSIEGFPPGIQEVVTIEDNFGNWTKDRLQQSVAVKKAHIESYIDNYFSEEMAKSILKTII